MNTTISNPESRLERAARWLSLIAGGPLSLLRSLAGIVAMLRAA